ncbi:class I SAM-dependent methyltransferase [Bacillus sp. FJAT-45350]|uniref:class I SAM-dependent methyltransferase n=1 Tax=Bacillus sp. FJAT-45350 TaxID=2011014 RepID=UPI000BB9892D|nr:methyltransferase domain-containing protein [Bacillus sp. FJAT-45350]
MNMWDEKFKNETYVYGTEANQFIQKIHQKLVPGHILAIAEGEGRNAVFLAKEGHSVTTWDYATSGLEKTKQLAKQNDVNVETELINLLEANWESEKWDSIINVFGHFYEDDQYTILSNVKKALKSGGTFAMEVYSTEQLAYGTGGPKDAKMLYKPEAVLQLFKDWSIIHFFYGEAIRHEGISHTGNCHVIQLLVKKP